MSANFGGTPFSLDTVKKEDQASSSYGPKKFKDEFEFQKSDKKQNNFEVMLKESIFSEPTMRSFCTELCATVLTPEIAKLKIFKQFVHKVAGEGGGKFSDLWNLTIPFEAFLVDKMADRFQNLRFTFLITEIPTFDIKKFEKYFAEVTEKYLFLDDQVMEDITKRYLNGKEGIDFQHKYLDVLIGVFLMLLTTAMQVPPSFGLFFDISKENMKLLKERFIKFSKEKLSFIRQTNSIEKYLQIHPESFDVRPDELVAEMAEILVPYLCKATATVYIMDQNKDSKDTKFLNLYGWLKTPNFKTAWPRVEKMRNIDGIFDSYLRDFILGETFYANFDGALLRLNLKTNDQIYNNKILSLINQRNSLAELVAQLIILRNVRRQSATVSVKRLAFHALVVGGLIDRVRAEITKPQQSSSDPFVFLEPPASSSTPTTTPFGPQKVKINLAEF
jgi:hypothetical protein